MPSHYGFSCIPSLQIVKKSRSQIFECVRETVLLVVREEPFMKGHLDFLTWLCHSYSSDAVESVPDQCLKGRRGSDEFCWGSQLDLAC